MSAFLEQLIALVSDHAGYAYLAVFLAALLEAVPIFGSLIPGSTVLLALSALIPSGRLDLVPVLAAAAAGAVLGDGVAFWIGHRSQRRILGAWPMSRAPVLVARSEAFFLRYGTLAVLFGRFVPPVRALVPITAGAVGMAPARFYPINVLAVLVWAPAHVLPGMIAADAAARAGLPGAHHFLPIAVGAVTTVALAVWAVRRWRRPIAAAADDPVA